MKEKRKYFKYNKYDILEILTETLAVENGFGTFTSNADLMIDNGEIFFVGVISELEDSEIDSMDLSELYKKMEYNGTHSDDIWLTDEQLKDALNKIDTGDF